MRIECRVRTGIPDGRSEQLQRKLGRNVEPFLVRNVDVYLIDDRFDPDSAIALLGDLVSTSLVVDRAARESLDFEWTHAVEIVAKPGVTDPIAATLNAVLSELSHGFDPAPAQTARQIVFHAPTLSIEQISARCAKVYNPLIEQASIIERGRASEHPPSSTDTRSSTKTAIPRVSVFPDSYPRAGAPPVERIEQYALDALTAGELEQINRQRLLALIPAELEAIRGYYARPEVHRRREDFGLTGATDVELEMFGQTWSEHCKHKIFAAEIRVDERFTVNGLFRSTIASVTGTLSAERDDLLSVFDDNSGVVRFDDQWAACFKAETHNSPSALDPYGGAITGIVGVNRDILGTGLGAKPIFNTNVLCFADPSCPEEEVPESLLPPARVLEGVHHGIVDGGNQSGIPVVAGGFLFDDSYLGKPLVFCGTGGLMPMSTAGKPGWEKSAKCGDIAVMTGGRIGKDGIHGATFSSLALDETSPTSAVQIGDPITQKKMIDFLLEARDEGLMSSLTDNGAGGLSSSLGEMARESGGIEVDLDRCPVKYEGLAPWEIWVSESQERMSAAVPPENLNRFLALSAEHGVESTAIGTFTDHGSILLRYESRVVCSMDMEFLHNGLPGLELTATWIPPERRTSRPREHRSVSAGEQASMREDTVRSPSEALSSSGAPSSRELVHVLHALLRDPNVGSREALIRRYDHEVQGATVGKAFVGRCADGPSDGGIVQPVPGSRQGLTVSHGICPRYGDWDAYRMAVCAVDEAYRAHIGLGGNPDRAWALDNFCWPDPVRSERTPDGEFKLAQLVRACRGLADACLCYGIPLISGKDSMKNDARTGSRTISVRPTLLVSLMGTIDDVSLSLSSDFKQGGDRVYLLGSTRGELGGTAYERHFGPLWEPSPLPDTAASAALYRALAAAIHAGLVRSSHDLSDGGLAAALAESAIGGRLGCTVCLDEVELEPILDSPQINSAEPTAFPDFPEHSMATREARRLLFSESAGRFVVSVPADRRDDFEAHMKGHPCLGIGEVTDEKTLSVSLGEERLNMNLEDLTGSWHEFDRWVEEEL